MIFKLNFQVTTGRALLSKFETTIDTEDLVMHTRTMQIRFYLDEQHFGHAQRQVFLKCVANIEQISNRQRQTSELVYIQSDDLQNLRLINSQRKGECNKSNYLGTFVWREITNFRNYELDKMNIRVHIRSTQKKSFHLQNRKLFIELFRTKKNLIK